MAWAIGCYSIECNSFTTTISDRGYFEKQGHLLMGDEILAYSRNVRTELCAFIDFCKEYDMEVVPVISATAVSHGPVTRDMFDLIVRSFLDVIRDNPSIEGVYVAVHGSSLVQGIDDPEGELLESIRKHLGDKPIIATCDFHANVTRKMVSNTTALIGWNDFPHVHIYEAGLKAAKIAFAMRRNGHADIRNVFIKIPAIVPLELLTTVEEDEPVTKIIRRLEAWEKKDTDILSLSFFGVHFWLDIDELGSSFVATVREGKVHKITAILADLAQEYWDQREGFFDFPQATIEEALAMAKDMASLPVIFNEPSDNVGAAAGGDHTFFLRALLKHKVDKQVITTMLDPEAVAKAERVGVGNSAEFSLGGKLDPINDHPFVVEARVRTLFEGPYIVRGKVYHGEQRSMGKTAILHVKPNILVQVTTLPALTLDATHYWCVGMFPEFADWVHIKSQGSFKAAYNDISRNVIYLDTPGHASSNIFSLPFKHPYVLGIYPFNKNLTFKAEEAVFTSGAPG